MKSLVALATLALSTAQAPIQTGMGTPYYSGMPPARYQGEASALVLFVDDVTPYCGEAPTGLVILACTQEVDGVPVIALLNPCPIGDAEVYARIVCHEKAHVLSWPGTHPQ